MNKHQTKRRDIVSFDKSISSNIIFSQPDKYRTLENISKNSDKIINVGSNLSYSPLGFSENSLSIEIKKFNRILNFDKKRKLITVEAGLTLIELLSFSLKHNLWIPQLPGYPTITIGGAVASNSHGKSCAIHGTIRKSVKGILLFHKKHGWLNLSENENQEIFDLTIGGIGLTGTIISVTFELLDLPSSNFVTEKQDVENIKDCKKIILEKNDKPSFIYTWNRADNFKHFGKGIVYKNYIDSKSSISEISEIRNNNFKPLPIPLWNKYSLRIANFFYYKINKLSKTKKKEKFLNVIFPFYGKENYFNFFGKKGFYESQLLIKESKIELFIEEFKELFKKYEPTITLFSLKNMSGDQKYLRFEDNKLCLTFDYVNNKKSLAFMSKVDNLCKKYEILPSIIKDSRINKNTFYECYKEALEFKDKLYKFDKDRVYQSEISNRLEI